MLCKISIEGKEKKLKNVKNILFMLCGVFVFMSLFNINSKAAGPMDGQIIDGSLLTSDESAFDEKPLLPDNPFEAFSRLPLFTTSFKVF